MRITSGDNVEIWARVSSGRPPGVLRPGDVPRPESVDEVAAWAGSEDFRRTVLIAAPILWVALPLAALGFLIQQAIADPTGQGWNTSFFGESVDVWPSWFLWLVWIAVSLWLLGAVGVLLLRTSAWRALDAENARIFAHGRAHSVHRMSVDHDDGEAGWATYVALDHRLDDRRAARIHEAFERWLAGSGTPPSGSAPISSEALFGPQAKGGYFFLHLPVSQAAGETTEHQWVLITDPPGSAGPLDPGDDAPEVIVTPVPVPKRLRRIRARLRRKAERRRAP
ncbi:hypothetical protein MUN78_15380 [Leucobacter allii]|uniref:Uncharacterized protein n=1 Tax=Leucobacter allii TaxID=2932247 RepID=A0ABY4FL77_9MICO|nr:hypothetical protein [Leucobacter allii]UOQ57024.1 hypothetical protein MUN78_15380 [Leucobacter allii]